MQDSLHITYIGHATTLIRHDLVHLLTDPHLCEQTLWSRRQRPLPIDPGTLPALQAILISHTHYDHLDLITYKYIPGDVPIIMPPGTAQALHPFVQNPVIELAHWVPHTLQEGVTITAVPVRHVGGRLIPGLRYQNVNGYIIQLHDHTIYFAGDTSYGTHFKEVGHLYSIDAALLPIGGMLPRWLSPTKPMHASDFIHAVHDLQCQAAIPIHWGTFGFSRGANNQVEQLRRSASERGLSDKIPILNPGESYDATNAAA